MDGREREGPREGGTEVRGEREGKGTEGERNEVSGR